MGGLNNVSSSTITQYAAPENFRIFISTFQLKLAREYNGVQNKPNEQTAAEVVLLMFTNLYIRNGLDM